MLEWLMNRAEQGQRTTGYPNDPLELPTTYLGRPEIDASRLDCPDSCSHCVDSCPTIAISVDPVVALDLGRCVFCAECVSACPESVFRLSNDFRTAATDRKSLVIQGDEAPVVRRLEASMLRVFRRSMRIRHVSAGDCGGCKDEFNALSNVIFDLSRFGISVVASPRHADALVISGPIPENMRVALEKCYLAMPTPRLVIALGACAISGGPFMGSPYCHEGVSSVLPVDMYIPGCPPHPLTVLDGLLRLLDRMPDNQDDKPRTDSEHDRLDRSAISNEKDRP